MQQSIGEQLSRLQPALFCSSATSAGRSVGKQSVSELTGWTTDSGLHLHVSPK
jgi:hypothetical protein